MRIQTSINASKVRTEVKSELKDFVIDETHTVAVTGDISKALGLIPAQTVTAPSGQELHAVATDKNFTAQQRLDMEKAVLNLSNALLPSIKTLAPGISAPIDGIELVFAGKGALDAWTDPKSTSIIKPLIKTTRVLVELADVVQTAVPALKDVPYFKYIGIFVKAGDSIYQFCTDYTDVFKPKETE